MNATSIELREASLGSLDVPMNQFEGALEVRPATSAVYVLTATGPTGTDARAVSVVVEPDASAVSFRAIPSVVPGGDVTTLVWRAPGAREVTLNGAQKETTGALTVRPLLDTRYALSVDGTPYTTDVTVQPAVLTFAATNTAVAVGQRITLAWTTAGATHVELSGPGRGVLFAAPSPDGTFSELAPTLPDDAVLPYVLRVTKGAEYMERTLEVFVASSLRITELRAPNVAARGGHSVVQWSTVSADEVELRVNGALTTSTTNPARVRSGSAVLPTPDDDFSLEFIATNARGARVTRTTQVDVVGVPTGITLTATPSSAAAGAPVTLSWASSDVRRVRIVDGVGQPVASVSGQAAENGSKVVYPPGDGTTYFITGDNQVGSTPVTASAAVTVTGNPLGVVRDTAASASPRLEVHATDTRATLVGFPHELVQFGTRADFIDVKNVGTPLGIANSPGVITVETGFTTWLWGTKQNPLLTVSRSGWMAFGAAPVRHDNPLSLPSPAAPEFLIAPFWSPLTLTTNSSVWWHREGEAPDERLIVQWDRLQVGANTGTEVTFQVQVHQRGTVSFHYSSMNFSPAFNGFVVGLQDGAGKRAVTTAVRPASDSALYFFSALASSADVLVARREDWGGFVQYGGVSRLISEPSPVISMPEDLALTEVMFEPGAYVKLRNRTHAPLDLSGWFLLAGNGARFDFPTSSTASPDVELTTAQGFSLTDTFFIGRGDAGFNFTVTPAADAGVATVVDPGWFRTIDTTSRSQTCAPSADAGCGFGYRSRTIAPHFVDISSSGTQVLGAPPVVSSRTVPVVIANSPGEPQPVIFGVQRPIISMAVDGYLVPDDTGTTTSNGIKKRSPAEPAAPRGTIAIFWDDLQTSVGGGMYWKLMAPNEDPLRPERHWIFQWAHARHVDTSDDLNFEVKLFEDGTIEYHYALMRSTNTTATVWLERGAAGVALTDSAGEPVHRAFTALRFIPQ